MPFLMTHSPATPIPIDVSGIAPDRIGGKTPAEIERIPILQGSRRVPVAELFRVSGDASDGRIDFEGDLRGVHQIGAGMGSGRIVVHGDAGRHLGAGMTGGTIEVARDAGDWAGAEMKGGLIRIRGSVGNHAGAAYPGSRRGMTDGTILIDGAAGDGIGRSLRRGMIAVGGSCGERAGLGMIAGTILVFGACAPYPGAEMRRGTIGLFGETETRLLPTFRRAGRFRPIFLELISKELMRLGFRGVGRSSGELGLYHGDLLSLGKGEVWTRYDGDTA